MLLEPHLLQTFAHSTIGAKGVAEQKVHIKEQLLSEFFHNVASTQASSGPTCILPDGLSADVCLQGSIARKTWYIVLHRRI